MIRKTIFTPLSPIKLFQALQAGWQIDFIIPYCLQSINNVQGIEEESQGMSDLVNVWDNLINKEAIHITIEEVEEVKEVKKNEGANGKPDTKGEKTKGQKPKTKATWRCLRTISLNLLPIW